MTDSRSVFVKPLPLDPSSTNSWTQITPFIVIIALGIAYVIPRVFQYLEFPILSSFELAWNALVYIMPTSLVLGLRSASDIVNGPNQHAEKSQALRQILGLGANRPSGGLLQRRKSNPAAPKGLGNWDNSCYQNSILQALSSLPSLTAFLEDICDTFTGIRSTSTVTALREITCEVNDTEYGGGFCWTPSKLKSMSSWQQQDAQEYFSKVVEAVEKDIKEQIRDVDAHCQWQGLALLNANELSERTSDKQNLKGFQPVANPLEGLLAQRVGCTNCAFTEGLSLIPFTCLTLPLGRRSSYDLSQCLDSYTELEYIDDVECGSCTLLSVRAQLKSLIEKLFVEEVAGTQRTQETNTESREQIMHLKSRLETIEKALQEQDFSESTLSNKCKVPPRLRKTSRKSRQAAIVRPPKCLAVHVNRSIFDETTGDLLKNHADVQFPSLLDLRPWTISSELEPKGCPANEKWEMDPSRSMLTHASGMQEQLAFYKLKALVTHYGRHENGHYICYRQTPSRISNPESRSPDKPMDKETAKENYATDGDEGEESERWWRLSDENVSAVPESNVLSQPGAFMLFYELSNNESSSNAIKLQEGVESELAECNGRSVEGTTEPELATSDVTPSSQRKGAQQPFELDEQNAKASNLKDVASDYANNVEFEANSKTITPLSEQIKQPLHSKDELASRTTFPVMRTAGPPAIDPDTDVRVHTNAIRMLTSN